MKAIVNTTVTLVLCAVFLFFSTSGLSVFTSEGVRRHYIEANPVAIPNVPLLDSSNKVFYIQDLKGKTVLVDFIFTNCTSICPMMAQSFIKIQKKLVQTKLQDQVVLLTVSFDPKRDTTQRLSSYARSVQANSSFWKFAIVEDLHDLQALLDTFGIVVIPAPNDQYEHNSSIHLVDRSGKLAKIYDYESTGLILKDLNAIATVDLGKM